MISIVGTAFKNRPHAVLKNVPAIAADTSSAIPAFIAAKPALIAGKAIMTITTIITIITKAVRKLIPAWTITS